MSDEQRDAIIGKVIRERSEAKKHLATLQGEATRLGQVLADIGRELQIHPEHVVFDRQPVNVVYSNPVLRKPVYEPGDVNSDQLIRLTNDIRATMDTIKTLDENASSFGIS